MRRRRDPAANRLVRQRRGHSVIGHQTGRRLSRKPARRGRGTAPVVNLTGDRADLFRRRDRRPTGALPPPRRPSVLRQAASQNLSVFTAWPGSGSTLFRADLIAGSATASLLIGRGKAKMIEPPTFRDSRGARSGRQAPRWSWRGNAAAWPAPKPRSPGEDCDPGRRATVPVGARRPADLTACRSSQGSHPSGMPERGIGAGERGVLLSPRCTTGDPPKSVGFKTHDRQANLSSAWRFRAAAGP